MSTPATQREALWLPRKTLFKSRPRNQKFEQHRVEGQTVGVYSIARTIADCFRFRNKIGLDVALEALTDLWRSNRLKLDELTQIATKLRIQRVMQPYLETIVM